MKNLFETLPGVFSGEKVDNLQKAEQALEMARRELHLARASIIAAMKEEILRSENSDVTAFLRQTVFDLKNGEYIAQGTVIDTILAELEDLLGVEWAKKAFSPTEKVFMVASSGKTKAMIKGGYQWQVPLVGISIWYAFYADSIDSGFLFFRYQLF